MPSIHLPPLPIGFLWPQFLWLLLLLPLLVLLYLWLLHRKRKLALRYASLAIVREAMGPAQSLKRHIPPLLMLLAIAAMLLAAARPTAKLILPTQQDTIVLAMDVSGSMRATDVLPSRLGAAQSAARAFLNELPRSMKVGIVAFAGTAQVVQAPTLNRDDLLTAINRFQLQPGTAIGNGLVLALATLLPDSGIDLEAMIDDRQSPLGRDLRPGRGKPFQPVAPGSYATGAIILLTDGQRTTGVDTMEAASMAANRGVRVYTVGVGTPEGQVISFEGWSMRVRLDEDTLKAVANATAAEYFRATDAQTLKSVYETLRSRLSVEKKETEVSGLLALLAAVLAILAGALSLLWFNRIL
ncbi:MAG: Aerotolerance protein BatA [Burkholderiaceae bacterium]|jgi:Ca-activated chloride channel family protein|nr:MAG: Aerotolerance protein BatA [Burkholderiaceae bacterium]